MDRLRGWTWKRCPIDRRTASRLGAEFEIALCERAIEEHPDDLEALVHLGDLYARTGRHEDGLRIDLRLIALCPEESVFHYNLACTYALLGDLRSSLFALEKALLMGYDNREHLMVDPDLEAVRGDPRFAGLLAAAFQDH
ncbi:MAG: hypothetical protein JXP34_02020 [Planctomycetes bacterium]|nr:hypothetical protein [Planctomycetota bacterium]